MVGGAARRPLLLAVALLGSRAGPACAQGPPAAPVHEAVDIYHGTRVADPYRDLEEVDAPAVQAWMKAQAAHTTAALARIPGRAALLARMEELDHSSTTVVSDLQWLPGDRLFYLKRTGDEQAARLYVRDGFDGPEVLLVDPDELRRATGRPHALDFFAPSPDGRRVAYGVSGGGDERSDLFLMDVATRALLDRPIDRTQFASPSWADDGRTLYYNRLRALPPGAPDAERYLRSSVHAHVVGTDPDRDPAVFDGTRAGVEAEPTDIPALIVIPGSDHVFGILAPGVIDRAFTAYTAPLSALQGGPVPWRRLFGRDAAVRHFDVRGDDLFLMRFHRTSRGEVIRTSLARPDLEHAAVIVPGGDVSLGDIVAAEDALYVEAHAGAVDRLLRVPWGGAPEDVPLPLGGTVVIAGFHPRIAGVLFALTTWTRAPVLYRFDPRARAVTETALRPPGPHGAPPDLVATEVEVKSHDGVLVPLSVVHRRGLRLDGENPTLLAGYGAYGISTLPGFTPRDLAWYERGGVLAFAHVRGGGERGEDWHRGGFQERKPSTWKDFIACAEWLVARGYTSPRRLAGTGTSAGGILVGRAMTERPDLFAAVIPRVGALDMLRFEHTATGAPNVVEFGSAATEAGFRSLFEMSTYHHVVDGTPYPAVLLVHGVNDTRVPVWASTKAAARLQAATASGKPVLLRLDSEAGHGKGATASQVCTERADVFAFVLWQTGVPGFTPAEVRVPASP